MNPTAGRNVPVNQKVDETLEVGNIEGKENEMSIEMGDGSLRCDEG
jgi:hypothetical protein